MFKPAYRVTPYLIGTFEKIASTIALIRHSPVKLPVRLHLERDAFNRSVHSSTWIEGNTLTLNEVAAVSARRFVGADKDQKKEVENCIASLRWILKNCRQPLTESRLLAAHKLMTKGLLPSERSGCYRKVQNYVVNAKRVVIFEPPKPKDVPAQMKDLFVWLKNETKDHPIVRSVIFHHRFVTIHPFTDGNGRVARAASQGLLFEKGYEPLYTLGLDEFFAGDRQRYYTMIQQVRELDDDHTHWIEYMAEGILDSVQKISLRIERLQHSTKGKPLALTSKQEEVLKLLNEHRVLGSADLCRLMNIKRARVNQLVAPLVKSGIVVQEGKTRAAKYGVK